MTTRFFKRTDSDKLRSISRAYFDTDRGCVELALERLADVRVEFPHDATLEYAEACLRKDSLGQGQRALGQFRLAQEYDPNHVFSAYNAAKFASSEEEYRARSAHARRIAPNDPDLQFFDAVDRSMAEGATFAELLANYVALTQQQAMFGQCAAAAELAIAAGEWSRDQELELRRARCSALRELDRAEEAARQIRRENYPPRERLALKEALAEVERVLVLDPYDPKMLNFKSAWLILMRDYEAAIAAADAALSIQPTGYLKPFTNKAWALAQLGRLDEAGALARETIQQAEQLGSEFDDDVAKAQGLLVSLAAGPEKLSGDEKLSQIATNILQAAVLTAKEALADWEAKDPGYRFQLSQAIQQRCGPFGQQWHADYISQAADLLHDFCPEWAWQGLMEFGLKNLPAADHYRHAALFVAAQADGVMARDVCRFNVLTIFSAREPQSIRESYRRAVLAPAAVDERFQPLAQRMRDELERIHPELPGLVADQRPIDQTDRERALSVALWRFRGETSAPGERGDMSPSQERRGCALGLVASPFLLLRRLLR